MTSNVTTYEIDLVNYYKRDYSGQSIRYERGGNFVGLSLNINRTQIHDVLCVPKIATNLISVSKLIQNGNNVGSKQNCCHIYYKKRDGWD